MKGVVGIMGLGLGLPPRALPCSPDPQWGAPQWEGSGKVRACGWGQCNAMAACMFPERRRACHVQRDVVRIIMHCIAWHLALLPI